jgi:hypothetical protein
MCDLTPVRNWLIATAAAIFVAVAIIVGAAIANGSWWYAWAAPFGMLAAAGATGLAILFCNRAIAALDTFCACAGPRCAGPCGNLRRTLVAAGVVLGIQATACLAAAAAAWIPVAGQVVMWTIIGALVIQAALIISAIAFMTQLATCQSAPAPTPPTPPPVGAAPFG